MTDKYSERKPMFHLDREHGNLMYSHDYFSDYVNIASWRFDEHDTPMYPEAVMDMNKSAEHFEKLTKAAQDRAKENDELREELDKVNAQYSALSNQYETMKVANDSLAGFCNKLQTEKDTLTMEVENAKNGNMKPGNLLAKLWVAEGCNENLVKRRDALIEKCTQLEAQVASLTEELKNAEGAFKDMQARKDALLNEKRALTLHNNALVADINKMRQEHDYYKQQNETKNQEIVNLIEKCAQLEAQVVSLKDEKDYWKARVEKVPVGPQPSQMFDNMHNAVSSGYGSVNRQRRLTPKEYAQKCVELDPAKEAYIGQHSQTSDLLELRFKMTNLEARLANLEKAQS